MLATMACFITLDSTMKYALQTLPLLEVTWARFFFATLIAAAIAGRNLPQIARTQAPGMQAFRSLFLAITTGLFNAGITYVPLPTGTIIMFLSPILVTALSGLVLGEHVGWRRWSSIAVGFLGALIVIRVWETGLAGLNHGALLLLAAAFTNATYQVATRKLRAENPLTTLLYSAAFGALITSLMVPFQWQAPDLWGWGLFLLAGTAGCVGHLCLIRAYSDAPATVVAPFSYSSLLWATLSGFAIWGDLPGLSTLAGAALIIGSGLYIFLRERKLGIAEKR
ncbi:MAG: DMT family transporter [Alphaproteobacteria bacterium]|nr:DMT family transporter [Alphaproteobacteria bacterium]